MANITPQSVDDIFNIPRNGSNISEEEDDLFDNQTPSQSFAEKTKEISETISKTVSDKTKKVEEKKEIPLTKSNKITVETALPKIVDNPLFGDIYENAEETVSKVEVVKTNVQPVLSQVKKVKTEAEAVTVSKSDAISEEPDKKAQLQSVSLADSTNTTTKWKLVSPSEKYSRFYAEKSRILSMELLKSGEIPFDQYYDELAQANVDTNCPTFDSEEVSKRIAEVQKWRDRVKFIQLHTNSQLFVWKQFVPLITGDLARIEYERGKQEGIVSEHLSDMYLYLGHLEGLYKSCEGVVKHLDGAYASLSRQVTITQPYNEVERYNTNGNAPKSMTPQLQRFDSLSTQANKTSAVAVSRSKEAGKPAEPIMGWEHV